MNNYTKVSVAQDARTELHDKLSLTGAEISVNNLPAGAGVPFVHSHKKNEEIYIILSGKGKAVIDGETVELIYVDMDGNATKCKALFQKDTFSSGRFIGKSGWVVDSVMVNCVAWKPWKD